ncbi:MAG: hypothetical protein K2J80_08515 [Oscillospiraceae bacterium]|nr:hypothetical protein [Oscillospiraceae bacterium]
MYDRYGDISKFITDPDKLTVADGEYVYISGESDYDIAVDLEGCYGSFDEVKPFIALVAGHINELDNIVLRFDKQKLKSKSFPFELQVLYIEKPNFVLLDYWCTEYNSQFDVVFEYKDGKFFLRKFGAFDLIPDDWDSLKEV